MDGTDQKIVQLLVADGRMTFAELGRRVNLSTAAVHHRVRMLEQRGIISGYGARLSATAIGPGIEALVAIETRADLDDVVSRLARFPEVEVCWTTAGTSDLLCRVRTADAAAMERLLVGVRQVPGVVRTRTTVLLATRFEREPDPVVLLERKAAEEG